MTPDQLADVIALAVHTATVPMLTKIAALEARPYVTQDFIDAVKENAADLRERVISMERRSAIPGPAGAKGDDGAPGRDGKDGANGMDGKDGAPGLNGKDGAAGLNGKDGTNGVDGKDGAAGLNGKDGAPGLDGKDGRNGLDGKDGQPGLNGKDGRDGIDGKDGAPGLDGKDGAQGLAGKDGENGLNGKDGANGLNGKDGAVGLHGKDGIGMTGALIDRDGHLVLTLSDGQTKDVGAVVGKDGAPGLDGKDGAPGLDGKDGAPGLNGKDGAAGIDGKDGFGFDDLDVAFDEAKGYTVRFVKEGRESKEFPLAVPYDATIWQSGRPYVKGAGVTRNGAWWIAQRDHRLGRPGDEDSGWRLAVKGGKDGKPGRDGRNGSDA